MRPAGRSSVRSATVRQRPSPLRSYTTVPTGTWSSTSAPLRPVRLEPSPWRAAAGGEVLLETEVEEGVEVGARGQVDRAAVTAVAAIRAAARHELLAPEAHGAAAAVAGGDMDVYFVDERRHGRSSVDSHSPPVGLCSRAVQAVSTGCTLITRPRAPWSRELHPAVDLCEQRVVLAEADVEARPERRPRWRTRIDPPVTMLPSKRLTPRRCELLSRPLRELPCPFL